MVKWRWQTDFYAGYLALFIYITYLLLLLIKAPFYVTSLRFDLSQYPLIGTKSYFYLQFIPSVLIVFLSSAVFGESFKISTCEYILSLPIKVSDMLFKRYLRLLVLLTVLHIPICLFAVSRINSGVDDFITAFPENVGFPYIEPFPLLIHCVVGIAFYIALAIFLLFLFKNRYLPVILVMVYCVLEAGPLVGIFDGYCVYYGSFSPPPLYILFPPNIIMQMLLTVFFLLTVSVFVKGKIIVQKSRTYNHAAPNE